MFKKVCLFIVHFSRNTKCCLTRQVVKEYWSAKTTLFKVQVMS